MSHSFLRTGVLFTLTLLSATYLGLTTVPSFAATPFLPSPPTLSAKSYLLIDASTNQAIVEHNADERMPPASLTKVMTAYVASHEFAAGKITHEDRVRVSVNAWRKGGSKMYIKEGTDVPINDILRGVIIQSGNDASIALAEHIAGSEEVFADLMNLHAKELGMTNSHFANATGWPDENHYTTARDLSLLTRDLIQKFPEHYQIYKEKEFNYNGITQHNRNLLLWRDSSIDGVKTGHTDEAGFCLVASAEREGMRLISVIMGDEDEQSRANDSQKLLNYGFHFFATQTLKTAEKPLAKARIWMGREDVIELGVKNDVRLTLPKGQSEFITEKVEMNPKILAPLNAGDELGQLTLTLDNKVVATVPLVALQAVEKAGFFKRIWHWLYLLIAG